MQFSYLNFKMPTGSAVAEGVQIACSSLSARRCQKLGGNEGHEKEIICEAGLMMRVGGQRR